jgi:two-component system, OmpR family, phosphate regulon response regulator PhoB
MGKILVIDDEADLLEVVDFNLTQAGHQVITATDGEAGIELARRHSPDLVLLDLMLPKLPGTEVCRALKRDPATRSMPVLILTARGEEIDRVVGFELGADDYVCKPFSVRELLLRVSAILKRVQQPAEAKDKHQQEIQFGTLLVDPEAHRAWVEGEEVELSALEFRLLTTLYERRNRVQSRAALLDKVWGITSEVTTRTVDTHVKRLREKLRSARNYIETVRGVGYRFVESPEDAKA